jgi:PQQ enzyme repeat
MQLSRSFGMHIFLFALLILHFAALAAGQVSVSTYHYDNYRTGWNQNETVLTPANVGSSSFGMLYNVTLDDRVDAQPLVIPGVNITSGNYQGQHDVVYVVTANNSVYAIDAKNGTVLLRSSLGLPVRAPLACSGHVGITSTPVIDTTSSTMYVIAYTTDKSGPTYRIHAIDLGSLADKVTPQIVTGSHALGDGSSFAFNAAYQRQRPALLLANGNVYAGFGSFCDFAPSLSRGWLLGWAAGSLTPLAANQILDNQASSPNSYFLSSIWMSGYGLASDDSGNILFVTGNSDPSGTTYDGVSNIQESVVKVSPDLSTLLDLFTPSNEAALDELDMDFGSGGVMVLPDQPGTTPHLAVAVGKIGSMFLMNEDHLGGFSTIKNNVLGTYSAGPCWCGPSYFVDADGAARVVSSTGRTVKIWKLSTSRAPSLSRIASSPAIGGGQDPGFFTTVSSNGASNAIVWALSHPTSSTQLAINLVAIAPDSGSTLSVLFTSPAGAWGAFKGNANLVPVVANGEVFVASYKQLQIFGLTGSPAKKTVAPRGK